ncbi:MAG: bifunctional diaminohydroxyphosphoribosylaminopyrimidine deaminase/5-amino-6-(5-phosphoribosylamino)uracil reductase RibD [Chloroflexi bacterium]|nr:bifunctional diaminohydroxyphosphoribosylaminopyrimidine deaminase/5-amino-6-(5-phosphoribosylamino)uracil reductase RibD [Chloroflexota bacterium]
MPNELDEEARYMRRAVALAARGAGRTSPNPNVGAVLVKDGEIVGEGYHHASGEAHAEVEAIRAAGARARGATIFVTLEPCAHQGRTPPCVDAVREAGIARVVAAVRDPDPKVDGRGFRALRGAGIAVEEGLLADEATRVNEGFLTRMREGRPMVLVKLATTMDGHVSVPGRRYLTGKRALREVHRLRDRYDAVLVGSGTIVADDPQLTVREVRGRDPLRVVVDTEARTPVNARVVRTRDPQRTMLLVARDAPLARMKRLREAGVLVATMPRGPDGLDLRAALRWLADQGVNTVLSEAGPRLSGAIVRAGLADRLLFLIAPIVGGGGATALAGVPKASELKETTVRRLGPDVAIEGRL